jgi:hypothetical protein
MFRIYRSPWFWLSFFSFLFPLGIALTKIYTGSIPFWYDIARDFLLAQQNLIKPTLIGPTSGIPGLFYGPYWIWYLSLGQLVSKDPRVVSVLLATLPYFVLFPLLLSSFLRHFDKKILLILWLVFMLGAQQYVTNLWNPNVAPLIFLGIIALAIRIEFSSLSLKTIIALVLLGFFCGLLSNFHISFGIGVGIGTMLFLIVEFFLQIHASWTKKISMILLFLACFIGGGLIAFVPTLLFEYRHGFHQINAAVFAIKQSVLYNSTVVGQVGLSKEAILEGFFGKLSGLFQVPVFVGFLVYGAVAGYIIALKRHGVYKTSFSVDENRLIRYLSFVVITILYVYLSSKNPIWDYHFIGVEIIMLLFLGLVMKKSAFFLKWMGVATVCLVIFSTVQFFNSFAIAPVKQSASYAAEYAIASKIYQDAAGKSFVYFEDSPSIYTYEYDYIFTLIDTKHIMLAAEKQSDAAFVYVIIPIELWNDRAGFLELKTPSAKYKTVKDWNSANGTHVFKQMLTVK